MGAEAPAPVRGVLGLAGVTGAAALPGDRLLLVTGEPNGVHLLLNASASLGKSPVTPGAGEGLQEALKGKVSLEDLKDTAWDGHDSVYCVTSHGRTPGGDSPAERYRLARLRFDPTGRLLEARQSDALLKAVVEGVPFLADSIRRTPARTGLNVEGLAWSPEGHLLVGLRSPTITESTPRPHGGQEDAVMLRVRNPERLFLSPVEAADLADVVKLDLRGQGIRGMAYDPARKGWWLLSGLSAAPNHPVTSPWGLWFWDGRGAPASITVPGETGLQAPEAVCRLDLPEGPRLLLLEGGKPASRFALLPVPEGR